MTGMKKPTYNGADLLFALAMAFFAVFFLFPVARTVSEAFFVNGRFSLRYVMDVLQDATYLEGLANAFRLGFWSTVVAVGIALPLAILADRFEFPAKRLLTTLLLVPLVLPPFVGAIGIKQILGQSGALNSFLSLLGLVDMDQPVDWLGQGRFPGMVLMTALHLYPIIYLNVSAALANLDPALEEAAENLGCPPGRSFFLVTLPMALPGLFAGCTVAFIWGFTELGVPLVFDFTRITSVQIFDGIKDLGKSPFPYALVVVVLALTATLFFVSKRLIDGRDLSSSGRASTGRQASRPLHGPALRACLAFFICITLLALLPHAGILLVAFSRDWYLGVLPNSLTLTHFQEALGHPITLPSIANSLRYAGAAMVLNLLLGVSIAYIVVRTKVRGREWLDVFSMLPLAVPGLVLAFGYLAMTREGEPFRWLVDLPPLIPRESPVLLLVIAYAVRRLPYIVRSAAAGFQQTSASLEEAAANLGAGPVTTFLRITGPLIAANLIAGAILAFAFSMLEVSDSLILAQEQRFFPITKAIYILFGSLGNGPFLAAALGVWAMLFLTVAIIGAGFVMGKKMGALFRI
jgi:iron(III) transport system permease protein